MVLNHRVLHWPGKGLRNLQEAAAILGQVVFSCNINIHISYKAGSVNTLVISHQPILIMKTLVRHELFLSSVLILLEFPIFLVLVQCGALTQMVHSSTSFQYNKVFEGVVYQARRSNSKQASRLWSFRPNILRRTFLSCRISHKTHDKSFKALSLEATMVFSGGFQHSATGKY